MKYLLTILLFITSLVGSSQTGEGLHFWGGAVITSGVNLSLDRSRPLSISLTMNVAVLKEYYDHYVRETGNHENDLWHTLTGSVLGWCVTDCIRKHSKRFPEYGHY